MDARLPAGDPRFHGMRGGRTAAARRSRLGLRNHEDQLRRLLVGRRRTSDRVVARIERVYSARAVAARGRRAISSQPSIPRGMKTTKRIKQLSTSTFPAPTILTPYHIPLPPATP